MTDYSTAEGWLRTIEFPDTAATDTDPPIHVITKPVRINGEPRHVLLDEVVVSSQPQNNGTMVSFTVYADDVEWRMLPPIHDEHGAEVMAPRLAPHRLFGLRVLSPDGVLWNVEPESYHDHVAEHGKDDPGPTMIDGYPASVRVVVFAREVLFTARD